MSPRRYDDEDEEDFDPPPRRPRRSGRSEVRGMVAGPAWALLITAGLTVALIVVFVPIDFFLLSAQRQQAPNATAQTLGRIAGSLTMICINGAVFYGALQMLWLQNFSMARSAAILALLPCCGPCYLLGIPFGIWALVVLSKPEVKSAFD